MLSINHFNGFENYDISEKENYNILRFLNHDIIIPKLFAIQFEYSYIRDDQELYNFIYDKMDGYNGSLSFLYTQSFPSIQMLKKYNNYSLTFINHTPNTIDSSDEEISSWIYGSQNCDHSKLIPQCLSLTIEVSYDKIRAIHYEISHRYKDGDLNAQDIDVYEPEEEA